MRTYTDAQTASYENLVALEYQYAGGKVMSEPIHVTVTAIYPIPKAASKKTRAEMLDRTIVPRLKPDIDNVIKAVLDGLNGIAYTDDTQVQGVFAQRFYGETPMVAVEVLPLEIRRFKDG